jgi:hypothetical protein
VFPGSGPRTTARNVLVNGGPVRRESPGSGRHREIPAAQTEDLPAVVSEELKSLKLRADRSSCGQQRPSLFQPDFIQSGSLTSWASFAK